MKEEDRAREWVEKIIQVRSGLMTVVDACRQLDVSRKTYYEKEKEALGALLGAVTRQAPGRPKQETDPEKEAQAKRIRDLQEEVQFLQQRIRIREVMDGTRRLGEGPGQEKKRRLHPHADARHETAERNDQCPLSGSVRDRGLEVRQPDAVETSHREGRSGGPPTGSAEDPTAGPPRVDGRHRETGPPEDSHARQRGTI
jgi:DNA-binding XRE family transcriptional regulator